MKKPILEIIQQGRVYLAHDGRAYRVGIKNDCRARLDPLFTKRRVITDRLHDKTVTIHAKPPSLNISPNTMLPRIA